VPDGILPKEPADASDLAGLAPSGLATAANSSIRSTTTTAHSRAPLRFRTAGYPSPTRDTVFQVQPGTFGIGSGCLRPMKWARVTHNNNVSEGICLITTIGSYHMLRIRGEQVDAMRVSQEREFTQQLVYFYRRHHPALVQRIDDEELSRRISEAMSAGRNLGISGGDGINHYVALAVMAGPRFMNDPTIHSFLSRSGLSPDLRVRDLLVRVVRKMQMKSGDR
jgi:hypothetical protein